MLETWEQAKVERLEKRVDELERKNWERSGRTFQWVTYGCMVLWIAIVVAIVASGVAHHSH